MSFTSLRAVLITDPLIVLATVVYGSASMVVSFFDDTGRKQIAIARAWARALLRISGVSVTVVGLEKVDPAGSYVFACNHASYMDTPVVLANIPVQFRFLAKSGLFRIPFLGDHLRRAGHIPVPLENPRAAVKTLTEAARVIRDRGTSLLIFPEGGRTLNGLEEFKEGAAYIAIKAECPVVPMRLIGTRTILPRGSLIVRPGHVTLVISDPVPTAALTLHERGRLTQHLYNTISAL